MARDQPRNTTHKGKIRFNFGVSKKLYGPKGLQLNSQKTGIENTKESPVERERDATKGSVKRK